jgi:hypothetical protein
MRPRAAWRHVDQRLFVRENAAALPIALKRTMFTGAFKTAASIA